VRTAYGVQEVQGKLFCFYLEAEIWSLEAKPSLLCIPAVHVLWNKQSKVGKKGSNFLLP